MEREYPKRPMVGVGAVIKKGNSVLVVRRTHEPGKGYWSIPGGLVELGETVREALKREVEEEVGMQVEIDKLLDVVDNIVYDSRGKPRFHYVLVDYLVHPKQVIRQLDPSRTRWVAGNELRKLRLTRTARTLLRNVGITC